MDFVCVWDRERQTERERERERETWKAGDAMRIKVNVPETCYIWGCHGRDYEEYCLSGCDTIQYDSCLPVFSWNVVPPSSRWTALKSSTRLHNITSLWKKQLLLMLMVHFMTLSQAQRSSGKMIGEQWVGIDVHRSGFELIWGTISASSQKEVGKPWNTCQDLRLQLVTYWVCSKCYPLNHEKILLG
jgi:hypothetical protein